MYNYSINTTYLDIEEIDQDTQYRKELLDGKRKSSPCNNCNAEGTMLGKSNADAWLKIYK